MQSSAPVIPDDCYRCKAKIGISRMGTDIERYQTDFMRILSYLVRPEQLPSRWSDWQFFGLIGAGFTRYGFASTCFLANSPEDSDRPEAFAAAVR